MMKRSGNGAPSEATARMVMKGGKMFFETRIRPLAQGGEIPPGKILILRTPYPEPGTTEEESWEATEQELIDDDGSVEAFCPDCAAAGHDPHELPWTPFPASKSGRNDPCPCGSGRKYKRCCLN